MGPFEMVVLIVLIITIAGLTERHMKTRSNRSNGQTGNTLKKQDQRLSDIEDRLKVLETIVTSDGYDLKQKFRDLDRTTEE